MADIVSIGKANCNTPNARGVKLDHQVQFEKDSNSSVVWENLKCGIITFNYLSN
jgi:hypothetical protein